MNAFLNNSGFDVFNITMKNAERIAADLPSALPWVEPSVNMLHLEAARALLFGASLASIMASAALAEHTLRMAFYDNRGARAQRRPERLRPGRQPSIQDLLKKPEFELKRQLFLTSLSERQWWEDTATAMRDAAAHMLIPRILGRYEQDVDGADQGLATQYYEKHPGEWGLLYHRAGHEAAFRFFLEATDHVRTVIERTRWQADQSWWKSQEVEYLAFFEYEWKLYKMAQSLVRVLR